MTEPRRLWAAGIFPWGTEIFGGIWDDDRLYLTRAEAIGDIALHASKMGLRPIVWSEIDEKLTIGRTHKCGAASYRKAGGSFPPPSLTLTAAAR